MKTSPSFLIFCHSLLASVLWAAEAKPPSKNSEASGDVRDLRVIRSLDQEPAASLLGQPSIALWQERHLVVAYQRGIAGKTDMGSIDAVVSRDDGHSWSIPSIVFDHTQRHGAMQFAYCNAVLYKPPGQDVIWCFAMRCPLNYANSEDSHLAAAYSGDGGRSWNPVELAMHYTGPLVMVMRTSTGIPEGTKLDGVALDPPRAWSTLSTDGGRTWSVAQEEPELWNTVSEAWFGQSLTGTQLYVYNDGPAGSRMALRYKIKPPGAEWRQEKTFFDAAIKNSYPTLIEIAPGEFGAVWDSGDSNRTRRYIRFGKLRLPQADP